MFQKFFLFFRKKYAGKKDSEKTKKMRAAGGRARIVCTEEMFYSLSEAAVSCGAFFFVLSGRSPLRTLTHPSMPSAEESSTTS